MRRWQSCAGARFDLHPEKMHDIAAAGKGIEVVGAIGKTGAAIVKGGKGGIVDDSADCEIVRGEGVPSTQRKNL